jgi:hypothetical protein
MILLIWASQRAADCAKAIEQTFQQPVKCVSTLAQGCTSLQEEEFAAVLVDPWIADADPVQADYLIHHLGGAALVFVNFAISGVERVLREVRAAFHRHSREVMLAHENARILLWDTLKDDLTAILLCCGVIREDPAISGGVEVRVKTIEEIACRMKDKLAATEKAAQTHAAHA